MSSPLILSLLFKVLTYLVTISEDIHKKKNYGRNFIFCSDFARDSPDSQWVPPWLEHSPTYLVMISRGIYQKKKLNIMEQKLFLKKQISPDSRWVPPGCCPCSYRWRYLPSYSLKVFTYFVKVLTYLVMICEDIHQKKKIT